MCLVLSVTDISVGPTARALPTGRGPGGGGGGGGRGVRRPDCGSEPDALRSDPGSAGGPPTGLSGHLGLPLRLQTPRCAVLLGGPAPMSPACAGGAPVPRNHLFTPLCLGPLLWHKGFSWVLRRKGQGKEETQFPAGGARRYPPPGMM